MEFHDNYPHYETMYQHTEEEGKPKRKQLWKVFWIMLVITIVELIIGTYAGDWGLLEATRKSGLTLKFIFVILTLVKAAYIVFQFMHLSHETKFFKYTILMPYGIFIGYLIFIILVEGTYTGYPENKTKLWDQYLVQQKTMIEAHGKHHGADHNATVPHEENKEESKHE
jgi:cytochrome c oxidase subunit IV